MSSAHHPTTKPDDVDHDGPEDLDRSEDLSIGLDHPTVVPTNFARDE